LKKTSHSLTDEDILEIAKKTEMFSGSDISILVRDACFQQVREL
jgi:SpoVK/Ycf46/Vps4 family AAA+-type ATPase